MAYIKCVPKGGTAQFVRSGFQQYLPVTISDVQPGDIINVFYNGSLISTLTNAQELGHYSEDNRIMSAAVATDSSVTVEGSGSVNLVYTIVRVS